MQSLDEFATGKLAALERVNLRRRLAETRRTAVRSRCCSRPMKKARQPMAPSR